MYAFLAFQHLDVMTFSIAPRPAPFQLGRQSIRSGL